jgi:NTP pyrophosphatase (non-canonical NTP hydrolase)
MTINTRQIIQEIGLWADQQPWGKSSGNARHAPDFGVLEELGELTHGVLKNYQGIRGFDDPSKFIDHIEDAIGDMMVYLSHWCFLHKTYFQVYDDTPGQHVIDVRFALMQTMISVHRLMELQRVYERGDVAPSEMCGQAASRCATNIAVLAKIWRIDSVKQLAETWDKVKQRNWNKDKILGGIE